MMHSFITGWYSSNFTHSWWVEGQNSQGNLIIVWLYSSTCWCIVYSVTKRPQEERKIQQLLAKQFKGDRSRCKSQWGVNCVRAYCTICCRWGTSYGTLYYRADIRIEYLLHRISLFCMIRVSNEFVVSFIYISLLS